MKHKLGDLVRINTETLHYHEGKLGIIIFKFDIDIGEQWYRILLEDQTCLFKEEHLEAVNENR